MNSSIFFNKVVRRAALTSAVALGAFGASNSFAASATTTSSATVIQPIAITKVTDLVFGDFAPGTAGTTGTVTVTTDNTRTANGAILLDTGATATAARFDVTGGNDAGYSISWGGATALSDGATTPSTMALTRISELAPSNATTGEVTTGTLSATGAQSIYLGGELAVGATQAPGVYTGDVTVTVEYN